MATTPTRQPRTAEERTQADDIRNAAAKDWRPVTDVAHENIARRAYQHYEERGREPGHAMDDWLQAEREIEQRRSTE